MHSVSIHDLFRKRHIPDYPTRRVPTLSTSETADRVSKIISALLRGGWSPDQINWQCTSCDNTVIQVVTEPLTQLNPQFQENPS